MFDWKSIDIIYTYDGTFEGLLTIVFNCFLEKTMPKNIALDMEIEANLFADTYQYIETDFDKSYRVFKGIIDSISDMCMHYVYNAFLSDDTSKDYAILEYLVYGFKYGPNVNTMLSVDSILYIQKLSRKVGLEVQRLKGFVRFSEIIPDLFYSKITPDNNVLELLKPHFINRFKNQNFIIHDAKRNIACLYNKRDCIITEFNDINLPKFNDDEVKYQNLWKAFFNSIAIKERTNSRLQKQYMPKRYWDNMLETQ